MNFQPEPQPNSEQKADGMYFCPAFANAMLYAGPSSWWCVGKNAHVSNKKQF
ncbi:MAG: hypothetical protein JSU03_06640 [Bacteroidetes bacterium]|nr:hypothetical protein [Bacteroidota bacterium]